MSKYKDENRNDNSSSLQSTLVFDALMFTNPSPGQMHLDQVEGDENVRESRVSMFNSAANKQYLTPSSSIKTPKEFVTQPECMGFMSKRAQPLITNQVKPKELVWDEIGSENVTDEDSNISMSPRAISANIPD